MHHVHICCSTEKKKKKKVYICLATSVHEKSVVWTFIFFFPSENKFSHPCDLFFCIIIEKYITLYAFY